MNNDYKTLDAMELYGGGFASAIARAASRADHSNYARLRAAFPDLWREYAEMAEQLERNREETRGSEEDSQ